MSWALALRYIQVLVWPVFATACILLFAPEIKKLLGRLNSLEAPGGLSVTFEAAAQKVEIDANAAVLRSGAVRVGSRLREKQGNKSTEEWRDLASGSHFGDRDPRTIVIESWAKLRADLLESDSPATETDTPSLSAITGLARRGLPDEWTNILLQLYFLHQQALESRHEVSLQAAQSYFAAAREAAIALQSWREGEMLLPGETVPTGYTIEIVVMTCLDDASDREARAGIEAIVRTILGTMEDMGKRIAELRIQALGSLRRSARPYGAFLSVDTGAGLSSFFSELQMHKFEGPVLDMTCQAIRCEWTDRSGAFSRQIIIIVDSGATRHTADEAALETLSAAWSNEELIKQASKRLVLLTPEAYPWSVIAERLDNTVWAPGSVGKLSADDLRNIAEAVVASV